MNDSSTRTGAGAHCVIHLRTYDLPPDFEPREESGAELEVLPDWYADWVHKTYRKTYRPWSLSLPARAVAAAGRPTELKRWAVVYPHRDLIEIAHLLAVPFDVALERADGVIPDEAAWSPDPNDASTPYSIQWTLDMTYRELTGTMVRLEAPRRAGLDHIVFVPVEERGPLTQPGLYEGDSVAIETAKLVVSTPRTVTDFPGAGGYLALAGFLVRGRHLVASLEAKIVEAAEGLLAGRHVSSHLSPWEGVHLAQQLQAEAIVTQSEVFGRRIPRHRFPASEAIARAAAETLGVPKEESAALQSATEALQGLSASTFGTAVDRSQRRFGVGGLIFAVISLSFSSIAILDFVQASPSDARHWVYVALGAALVVALAGFAAVVVLIERTLSRRRDLRREGPRESA